MTAIRQIAGHWFGLCRKPPVISLPLAGIGIPAEYTHGGVADGGGSGSGTIRRGIRSALSAITTLIRNRQLLWFMLLAGLVLAGSTIGQAAFLYIEHNLHMALDSLTWRFFIEYATLFCLVFLLAGLFLSIPSRKGGPASFFEGIVMAKKYMKAIISWSFILTFAGMLLVIVFSYVPARFPTPELLFLYHHGFGHLDSFLFDTLSQFPFNVSRLPPNDIFTEIPGYGGRSVLLWFYPGIREALVFLAINLLLFILTPFVVPHIVLGQKTLPEAVAGSFAMMKKSGGEVAACNVILGIIVSAVFLMHLLLQAVHGMVTPLATYYRPTGMWIALGLVYDIVLFSVALAAATAGGIAVRDLYASADSRLMTGSPGPDPLP
jgi:hypothetical protein